MQESKGFWSWRCRVVPPGMGSSFGHSAFIHFFWKNKVLLTFYLDRFFLLPPLHLSSLSSYDTSPDVSLDIFFFPKTSGRNSDSCHSVLGLFDDWLNMSSDSTPGFSPLFSVEASGLGQRGECQRCVYVSYGLGCIFLFCRTQPNAGSCHPTENGRQECYIFQRLPFKGMVLRFLRKTSLSCKNWQRLGEDLHLNKSERELTVASFLK